MQEWWTYRLEDFLLFSPRVYWRMFELHNAALWPFHVPAALAGFAALFVMLRSSERRAVWISVVLATLWALVGWTFLWNRYAEINWAIAYVSPIFGLQAVLLLVTAATGHLTCDQPRPIVWPGMLLASLALVAYPATAPLMGRSWSAAEVFGIAPDPTAVFTLAILVAFDTKLSLMLSLIPICWLLISSITLYTLGEPQAWIPLSVVACILILRHFDRSGDTGGKVSKF
jgi:hypothetical protein